MYERVRLACKLANGTRVTTGVESGVLAELPLINNKRHLEYFEVQGAVTTIKWAGRGARGDRVRRV